MSGLQRKFLIRRIALGIATTLFLIVSIQLAIYFSSFKVIDRNEIKYDNIDIEKDTSIKFKTINEIIPYGELFYIEGSITQDEFGVYSINSSKELELVQKYEDIIFITDNAKLYFNNKSLFLTYDGNTQEIANNVENYSVSETQNKVAFTKVDQKAIYTYNFTKNKTIVAIKETNASFENIYLSAKGGYLIVDNEGTIDIYGADSGKKYTTLNGKLIGTSSYEEVIALEGKDSKALLYNMDSKKLNLVDLTFEDEELLTELNFTNSSEVSYLIKKNEKIFQVYQTFDMSKKTYYEICSYLKDVKLDFLRGKSFIILPDEKHAYIGSYGKYVMYDITNETIIMDDLLVESDGNRLHVFTNLVDFSLENEIGKVNRLVLGINNRLLVVYEIEEGYSLEIY
jgi:hypothetical protein